MVRMENERNTVLFSVFHSFYPMIGYNMTAYNISVKMVTPGLKFLLLFAIKRTIETY